MEYSFKNKSTKKLIMVVNEDRFFLSHRKEIALSAQKEGWDVTIVCKDIGQRADVEALGLKMLDLPINPTGTNILQELKTFRFLLRLYQHNREAVVHHVGLKLILWGGLAARFTKVRGVVNAVSGLGVMFSNEHLSFIPRTILQIIRFANHRPNVKVVFQNHEDEALFKRYHVVTDTQTAFIKGSGVDLDIFKYHPSPESNPLKVLFTGRMVKEKGVIVLVEAAEILRQEYEDKVQFLLCGGLHDNPKALKEKELKQLCDGKYIQWLGFQKDVKSLLEASHIVAFPSYYREGVPKSLIEACAIGRPIITTNSIGCKDTVDEGYNGFLIPVKDSTELVLKLKVLFEDKDLRTKMGRNGRTKAEKEFSLKDVISRHLEIYSNLLN